MNSQALLERLTPAFSDAYAEAVRSGLPMRAVAAALEDLRDALAGRGDHFDFWHVMDEQLGRAADGPVLPVLRQFATIFEKAVLELEPPRLLALFQQNPVAGTDEWFTAIARCFGPGNWRYTLFTALLTMPGGPGDTLEAPFHQPAERARLALCASTQRWAEIFDWMLMAGRRTTLDADARIRPLVIAAEIQLFCFRLPSHTRRILREAAALDRLHPRVLQGLAEYHLEAGRRARARRLLDRLIATEPTLTEPRCTLGDWLERAGTPRDKRDAESQYEDAMMAAPGVADPCSRLLRLIGPAESRAPALRRRLLIFEPDESALIVDEGDALRAARRWADAAAAYENAAALNPSRLSAFTGLGWCRYEEAASPESTPSRVGQCHLETRAAAARARELAPTSADPLWLLASHSELVGDWRGALGFLREIRACHPAWAPSAGLRAAIAHRQLGELAPARESLRDATRDEPQLTGAAEEWSSLADSLNRSGDHPGAVAALAAAREINGQSWEHHHQNQLGNFLYSNGDYASAVPHYRRACELRPGEAILHSNLAGALALDTTPGAREANFAAAIAALKTARELDPASTEYPARLTVLERKLAFIRSFGETAAFHPFTPEDVVIGIQPAHLPALVDGGNLSPVVLASCETLRAAMLREHGVAPPFLLFRAIPVAPDRPDAFTITILGDPPIAHDISPGALIADTVLDAVRDALTAQLPRFITHDSVAQALAADASPDCQALARDPARLTAFVRQLRARCASGQKIPPLAEAAAAFPADPSPPAPDHTALWDAPLPPAPPTVISLAEKSAVTAAEVLAELNPTRDVVLAAYGICVPLLQIRTAPALDDWAIRITVGQRELPLLPGLHPGELWLDAPIADFPGDAQARPLGAPFASAGVAFRGDLDVGAHFPGKMPLTPATFAFSALGFLLGSNLDALIDDAQIMHRLELIQPACPRLTASIKSQFTRAELIARLRAQLINTRTLLNFPAALERSLSDY